MVEEPEVGDAGGEQVQHGEVEEQVSDQLLLPGLGVALGGLQGVHLRLQLLQDLLGGGLTLKSQHTCWESWAYVTWPKDVWGKRLTRNLDRMAPMMVDVSLVQASLGPLPMVSWAPMKAFFCNKC